MAVVIGFVAIVFLGIIGNLHSDRQWKRDRANILNSVEQAVDTGDFEKALFLAEPHQSRNDPALDALVAKAHNLKLEAAKQARQERIAGLVEEIKATQREERAGLTAEIKAAQGEEREAKLERLLLLSPNTEEFSEELPAIREKINKRKQAAREKMEAERQAENERKQAEREKMEAERQAGNERTEKAQEEQARIAMEAMLAEFKWRYQVTKDELTSKPTYVAYVNSINQINFDFPYHGAQRGTLMLRTHPQHGKDLILRVEKGQMLVRSYEDTTVKVVFDKGSPVTYRVTGPADHSTTSLFFRDYQSFVGRMLKAKKVKISVPFYQQGEVVFEFNVSDFDSNKYLDKN